MKKVRVRYAPSPTGKLHIGGARTALFNYLFTKSKGGDFILRIEDTDLNRNIIDGEKEQIDGLEWLGIIPDFSPLKNNKIGGPYKQSERKKIYEKYFNILEKKGYIYKCYCTKEELELSRKTQIENGSKSPKYDRKCLKENIKKIINRDPVYRFKVPDNEIYSWVDGVRGEISVPSYSIGDWVVKKSNGMFTFNFVNAIDDYLMQITDVLRGEEHISNTPKQLMIFKVLNWESPNYYHLTIIVNSDGKKLSKRDETLIQFISLFKERGYLSSAIFNYLSLLGWTPNLVEEEIFSKEKLIKIFDEKRLSKSPSTFDIDKLKWTNNYYIKKLGEKELFDFLNPFLTNVNFSKKKKIQIFSLFQKQIYEGIEIKNLIKLFEENKNFNFENKDTKIISSNIEVIEKFYFFINKLDNLDWSNEKIKKIILDVGRELSKSGINLMKPLRLSITRFSSGPDLSKILEIYGRSETKKRIKEFLEHWKQKNI